MRKFILPVFLVILCFPAFAQDVKTDFNDGEFFLIQEEYAEALYAFGKVYKNGYQDNAYVNYRMGECLVHLPGRKTEAIPYLEKAVGNISEDVRFGKLNETAAPPDAYLYLGNAYRINMEISKATDAYDAYLPYMDEEDELTAAYVAQQKDACANLMTATSAPAEYRKGNLGQIRGGHTDMYNMLVSNDGSTMAYMGKNPFYNGVYVAVKEGDVWGRTMNITPSIASDGNMDVVALSSDGKKMLLAVTDEFASNIYEAVYENDRWNNAVSLDKPINSRYFESTASYAPDGSAIYFSSNRKESLGGTDIFRSDKQEDGSWGQPVNLGEGVNTMLNEEGAYLSPDGSKLYFTSQGHKTLGGYDLFYSELQEDGSWGEAINPGYPMNSPDDDFSLMPEGCKEEGYAVIHGQQKMDGYDIFKFEIIGRDETPVPVPLDEPVEEEVVAVLDSVAVDTVPEKPLAPPAPEEYLIDALHFGFDSSVIPAEGKKQLDKLAGILEKYAAVKLEIYGHTDNVGTESYNMQLSERRAKAAFDYLIDKGIDASRLSVVAKGETLHIARNRTKDNRDAPEGRKFNRRVEFHISLSKVLVVKMAQPEIPDNLKL